MMTTWHRLTDARGRRHKAVQIHEAVKASGIDRDVLVPRSAEAGFWNCVVTFGGTFVVPMMLFFAVQSWWQVGAIYWRPLALAGVVSFFGFGMPMALFLKRLSWRSADRAVAAMLESDLCPACAHGLNGLPPAPDGCTVCPECGAAWRVDQSP